MTSKVKTTGAPLPVKPRLEIKEFMANKKQFSLYVQALNTLYSELKTEVLSYFSLSKIHGRPFGPWNNVDPPLNPQGQPKGFCVHHEIQFLTWHRPYVALFEQEIYKRANSIAKEYKADSEAWIQAASDLRQPYWNWADPSGILPQALLDLFFKDSVTIGPASKDGAESSVSNPFCLYHFKDGERDGFTTDPPTPVVDWPQTLRYPTSKGPEARSNMTKFNTMLNLEGDRIRYDTERLSSLTTWKAFSSDGGKTTNSLEKIHDDMHDLIGGIFDGGHMSRIPFAAFDPIFWLHHAQIDRLTDKWHSERQLWAPDADHKPFRNSDTSDTFWNSNQIQEPKSFNYEYKPAMQRQPGWGKEFGLVDEDTILEWSVRIRYKAFELGGNFSILLFFTEDESPIPEDPHDRYDLFLLPNYIGSFNTFINP
ncbi:hypothetical protein FS842_001173, partial [Serendipita sp. 407]